MFSYLVPSGGCGAQAPFECLWLLWSAYLLLLTEICDESLMNNREKRLRFHNPASYIAAEMKFLFCASGKRGVFILMYCTDLNYFIFIFAILGVSTWFEL